MDTKSVTVPKWVVAYATYLGIALVVWFGVALWLMWAWDWFVSPVFHLNTLSMTEALGLAMFLASFAGYTAALREVPK